MAQIGDTTVKASLPAGCGAAGWPRISFRAVVERLLCWSERARQRRDLARLNPRLMADLGIDRADVQAELAKPFWRD